MLPGNTMLSAIQPQFCLYTEVISMSEAVVLADAAESILGSWLWCLSCKRVCFLR